jgi:hypothetical protein
MTRVEGENTRLRHYLARLKRKTLCYSKSEQMLRSWGVTTRPKPRERKDLTQLC